MKKLISLLLTTVMLMSFAAPVFAEDVTEQPSSSVANTAETTADEAAPTDIDLGEAVEAPTQTPSDEDDETEAQIITEEQAQEMLSNGAQSAVIEQVPTPDDIGEVVETGSITLEEIQELNLFSKNFNSIALTDFSSYGETLYSMQANLGGTVVTNFGALAGSAYNVLNDDINKGTSGFIFLNTDSGPSKYLTVLSFNYGSLSSEQVKLLVQYIALASYYAVDWDNPAMFYSNGALGWLYSRSTTTVTMRIMPRSIWELADYNTRVSTQNLINARTAELAAGAAAYSTDLEKVAYFNKWLCDNNTYNTAAASSGSSGGSAWAWSAASGLLSGTNGIANPVCEGYSRAMQTLCKAVGINCTLVTGDNHMWNNIKINGAWYGNDSTWNDSTGRNEYYLLTTNLNNSYGHTVQGISAYDIDFDYPQLNTNTTITQLVLDTKAASLEVGDTRTLIAYALPGNPDTKEITWTSSNTSVARVAYDGTVTARAKGSATITARAPSGVTATCTINVGGVSDFVERMYTVALGRASDAKGKADWVAGLVEQRVTGAQVAKGFIISDEFAARKLSDDEFLTVVYKTFFNRAPDAAGKADWVKALSAGMSREFVVCGFAVSDEFNNLCNSYGIVRGTISSQQARDKNFNLTSFVSRLYSLLLNRKGDEKGLNDWCGGLINKIVTPKTVAHGFVFSAEFEKNNYTDRQFIEYMYRAFLGREYDENGMQDWLRAIKLGYTHEQIFNGFADSAEFGRIVASFGL